MSRLPIRARLTAAFALATVLVLAAAGLFTYLRLRDDLNESVDAALQERAAALVKLVRESAGAPPRPEVEGEPEERFAQVLSPAGSLLSGSGGTVRPALGPGELRRAADRPLVVERRIPGLEGTARVFGVPASGRSGDLVLVVGH